jgi:hypothetical protein
MKQYILAMKVSPGAETNFVLERTVFNKKSAPYSNCVADRYNSTDTAWVIYAIEQDKMYVQKRCIRFCALKLNSDNNKISCAAKNDSSIECLNDVTNQADFYPNCSSFCPIECSYTYLTYSTMYSDFPSLNYASKLMNDSKFMERFTYYPASNMSYDRFKSNILKVNIFFKNQIIHTYTEHAEVGFEELLGNLGGQLVRTFLFKERIKFISEITV